MRVLLLVHEGELDYRTLSDDAGDCEVAVFIGGIKLRRMIRTLINRLGEVK